MIFMKKITTRLLSLMLLGAFIPSFVLADTWYLDKGDIFVEAKDNTQTVSQDGGVTKEDRAPVITNNGKTENTVIIKAEGNATANVTLENVNIDVSSKYEAAITTSGEGNVNIELNGTNKVVSSDNHAGLEKNNNGTLTITDTNQDNGSLTATGGFDGAGIGGGQRGNGSNITISDGEVTATGAGAVLFHTGVVRAALNRVGSVQLDVYVAFAGGGDGRPAGINVDIFQGHVGFLTVGCLNNDGMVGSRSVAGDDGTSVNFCFTIHLGNGLVCVRSGDSNITDSQIPGVRQDEAGDKGPQQHQGQQPCRYFFHKYHKYSSLRRKGPCLVHCKYNKQKPGIARLFSILEVPTKWGGAFCTVLRKCQISLLFDETVSDSSLITLRI